MKKWPILALLLLCGCGDEVPLKTDRLPPSGMSSREWDRYIATAGIQADSKVKTFTPTWTGFSADPVGDLSYYDFGSLVVLWNDSAVELVGTSNTNRMTITNLPAAITPNEFKWRDCLIVNNDFTTNGSIGISTAGVVEFYFHQVAAVVGATEGLIPQATGFNTANNKGVPSGWLVMFSK